MTTQTFAPGVEFTALGQAKSKTEPDASGTVTVAVLPMLSNGRIGDYPRNYRAPKEAVEHLPLGKIVQLTLKVDRAKKDGASESQEKDWWVSLRGWKEQAPPASAVLAAPAAQPAPAASPVPSAAHAAPQEAQQPPVPQNGVPWTRYFPFGDLMARAMEMRREIYGDMDTTDPSGSIKEYRQELAWCYAALVAMVRGEQEKP